MSHNEDTETPTPENAPLIRQAVGFSWTPSISANVSTYQATVAQPPVVPYFLPGQAPPPPPKPKISKPRAPRRKRGEQYSDQTNKFKLSGSTTSPASDPASLAATSPGNSADTGSSSGAARSTALSHSMIPSASYAFGYRSATAGPISIGGATASVAADALPLGSKRTRKSSKRGAPASANDSFSSPSVRPPPRPPAPIGTFATPQYSLNVNPGAPPAERPRQTPDLQRTYSASPSVGPGGTPVGHTNPCKYH